MVLWKNDLHSKNGYDISFLPSLESRRVLSGLTPTKEGIIKPKINKGGEGLPKSKSSLKRARQNEVRRAHNVQIKSAVKTAVKKAEQAIDHEEHETGRAKLIEAISTSDKAASKGVIPKRRASRKISRLSKRASKQFASGKKEANP